MNRIGDWIQTFTGVEFYPCDPCPNEICIEDIAHALSMQCRFTGHCRKFYSVAEHSVHVSYLCHPSDALWGLLHDASEAYLCDLARPVKKHSELGRIYEGLEAQLMLNVCAKFNLPLIQPESVESADKRMLYVEAKELLGPLGPAWDKWKERLQGNERYVQCWGPPTAEKRFLDRYRELTEPTR
jgi:hypothetical protein